MDIPYLLLKSDSYETREVPESHFFRVKTVGAETFSTSFKDTVIASY